ncbi:MAG: hypothetical protein ACRDIL_03545 [Candidatus Limnocylindrales bacterium]
MGHKDKNQSDQGQGHPGQGQGPDWTKGDATKTSQGGWNDRSQREMEQGDRTKPEQPEGTTPLERDQRPINQSR